MNHLFTAEVVLRQFYAMFFDFNLNKLYVYKNFTILPKSIHIVFIINLLAYERKFI